ncbi:ferredoxin [Amycolatopsis mediterranei S699]|jgi:ferredoxin|uniref:Ferredoxin n=2 Tax=Amycolatopsis mediterranei TaxID=33910 RepID=A0A0H3CWK1_AMYMU|nr:MULTISPECIES: ferredoxin [Amycolatopsis]ADJ42693.1 ferredoxin [Amycolatopsis mediterranei U32]AEK39384.1 ferredoxin [Amycolatopsis mediterranei S699]AFO74407.1 ferredoxin [Amycolatopsis mediterranei S699]AGT81536.1 ferredoxin [Amycolatopsis mediterranei RB]KDO10007.1 ferredoxin [Amycolatopsis mediterranei]
MKIIADTGKCVGAGQCVLTEPSLFDQSEEDGTVIVLDDQPQGELVEKAREAVHVCPSQALSLQE